MKLTAKKESSILYVISININLPKQTIAVIFTFDNLVNTKIGINCHLRTIYILYMMDAHFINPMYTPTHTYYDELYFWNLHVFEMLSIFSFLNREINSTWPRFRSPSREKLLKQTRILVFPSGKLFQPNHLCTSLATETIPAV